MGSFETRVAEGIVMLTDEYRVVLFDRLYVAYMNKSKIALQEVLQELGPIEIIQNYKSLDLQLIKLILDGFYDNKASNNDTRIPN